MRIGAVNYLNTKPLIHSIERLAPHAKLVLDLPSRLADDLAEHKLDVALIPSIELFQNPTYAIISDACIGCRGPVLSVKLFSRVPLPEIRTLALDEGSRTSAAMLRILLKSRYDLEPDLHPLPIGYGLSDTEADAVLLIGDRAMHSPSGKFSAIWDLGDEWCRWSELPFVFAMWVARTDVALGGLNAALRASRDEGVANLDAIAAQESAALGLTKPQCLSYLRDNLNFYLGPREQQGLELFFRESAKLGLAPADRELRLHGCQIP